MTIRKTRQCVARALTNLGIEELTFDDCGGPDKFRKLVRLMINDKATFSKELPMLAADLTVSLRQDGQNVLRQTLLREALWNLAGCFIKPELMTNQEQTNPSKAGAVSWVSGMLNGGSLYSC